MIHYASIWQDIYYEGSDTAFEYQIRMGNDVIYTGRAYAKPSTGTFSINISKICQDYLSNSLPIDFVDAFDVVYSHSDALKSFELWHEEQPLETYNFLYCWDYRYKFDGNPATLSDPINGHYSTNAFTFLSSVRPQSLTGGVETVIKRGERQTGYDKEVCGSGALYYINRKGGWDTFIIEGSAKRKDIYDKYSYNRSFNNNTVEFEEGTYHNQITTEWSLHTGFLRDDESKRLAFNLLPSNQIYFHDFETDTIIPVVMTNSEVDYKTYHNQSNKMVAYELKIRESQRKQLL